MVETRANRSSTPNARSQIVPSDSRFSKAARIHFAGGIHGAPSCGSSPRPTSHIVSSTRNTEKVTCRSCANTKHYKDAVSGKISKLTDRQQRARVYAAGAVPGPLGAVNAAREAGLLAPAGQKKQAVATQYGSWAAGASTGAVAGSHIAARTPGATELSHKIKSRRQDAANAHPKLSRIIAPRGPGRIGRKVAEVAHKPGAIGHLAKPFAEHPEAAALGAVAGKVVGAGIGGYAGYSAVLRRQHAREAKMNSVAKAIANDTGMSQREQRAQLKRKRRNLGISMVTTGLGTAGAGLLAARELGPRLPRVGGRIAHHAEGLERAGLSTALASGAAGAYGGAHSIGIQRRDLDAQEKVLASKARGGFIRGALVGAQPKPIAGLLAHVKGVDDGEMSLSAGRGFTAGATITGVGVPAAAYHHGRKAERKKQVASKAMGRDATLRASFIRRTRSGSLVRVANTVAKLDTTLDHKQAQGVVSQYGLRGPLPKNLPRDERVRAYEGRYIAAGGPKGEKWKRRSNDFDHITGATIAGAAGAVGVKHLAESKPGGRVLLRHRLHPERIGGRAGHVAETLGAAGAVSELAHRHAQHRAASYRSSPAGVAASALTRLRNYTPDD